MKSSRISLLLLCTLVLTAGTSSSGKGLSANEARQRVVAISHKLESAPLDAALAPEAEWARQWVIENPDLRIRMCMALLAGLRSPKYQFRHQLSLQMMLSSAAFLIEHPDKAGDHLAESVGGMQGVLKAYSAILKSNPDAHSKTLDDLLQKQSQGKLTDSVRDTITVCHF